MVLRCYHRHKRLKCYQGVAFALMVLVIIVCGSAVTLLAAASQPSPDSISWRDHQSIVLALQDQIVLIKWIGGAIVSALVSALVFLHRALDAANKQSREDLVEGIKRRERLVEEMTRTNTEVIVSNQNVTREIQSLNAEVREMVKQARGTNEQSGRVSEG